METSQQQISQIPGEGERGDGISIGKDGKSPSKKTSKEKSSQKQIDTEGCTPVKGKKIKGSAKGKGTKTVNSEYSKNRYKISLQSHLHACGFEIVIPYHFMRVTCGNGTDNDGDVEAAEEETFEKLVEPNVRMK